MRRILIVSAAVAALGLATAVSAQPAPGVDINIAIGPVLQAKVKDFGSQEIDYISKDLHDSVTHAVLRSKVERPVRVDLLIEDATPNRPTFEQLGRTTGLSFRSIGLGGARISGIATYADGSQRPFKEQFFETDLRDDRGADTWFDADRAFDQVAYDIGHGRLPVKFSGPGPSGSGHFGYPFNNQ